MFSKISKTVKFSKQPSGIGRVFAKCNVCGSKVNKYFSWRQLNTIQSDFLVESTVSTKAHSYENSTPPRLHLQGSLR